MAEKTDPFILMVHKDFKDRAPARVLRTTFEKMWKDKGWSEFKEDSKEPASPSTSTASTSGGPSDK